jgi:hypothetical protein
VSHYIAPEALNTLIEGRMSYPPKNWQEILDRLGDRTVVFQKNGSGGLSLRVEAASGAGKRVENTLTRDQLIDFEGQNIVLEVVDDLLRAFDRP